MSYTINVIFVDVPGIFGGVFPLMGGTITSLTWPIVSDTTSAQSPPVLNFTSAAIPPPGVCAVLVQDNGVQGDLFRSGRVSALPPSPATLMFYTNSSITLFSEISAAIAAASPFVPGIPTADTLRISALSGGMFIPLSLTITGVGSLTSLAVTVIGTLVVREFLIGTTVRSFTLTFTPKLAPSGDAVERARILTVTATSPTLTASGVPGFISAALAPIIATIAASQMEGPINSAIASAVNAALPSIGRLLSPTAAICAQKVTVASDGLHLQLTLSDLLGPALLFAPKNFSVAVIPPPQARTQQKYTATVTGMGNNAPIPQAKVTLHNFDTLGHPLTEELGWTDPNGEVDFNGPLHPHVIIKVVGPNRDRERVFISPTLAVELAGYNMLTMTLLMDDGI